MKVRFKGLLSVPLLRHCMLLGGKIRTSAPQRSFIIQAHVLWNDNGWGGWEIKVGSGDWSSLLWCSALAASGKLLFFSPFQGKGSILNHPAELKAIPGKLVIIFFFTYGAPPTVNDFLLTYINIVNSYQYMQICLASDDHFHHYHRSAVHSFIHFASMKMPQTELRELSFTL